MKIKLGKCRPPSSIHWVIFGANEEESLTQSESEDLEYSIENYGESLKMKVVKTVSLKQNNKRCQHGNSSLPL